MKRGISICIFNLIILVSYSQHDSQFSQYMFNVAAINPGFVGSGDMICLSAINRQQWVGFEGAPNYSFVSAHAAVNPFGIKSGALILGFNGEFAKSKMEQGENIDVLKQAMAEVLEDTLPVRCVIMAGGKGPDDIDQDGMVASALRDLGGEIVDIQ